MTMKELAKLANVSVSTVSKAFSEADDISAETKAYIFQLAREYGCYGRYFKGKYHKKIVAIICPELIGNYYTCFIDCFRELIEAADGMCVVSADNFSPSKQAELIDYYIAYLKVDGLIVFNLNAPLKKAYDRPIVALFSNKASYVDFIQVDMRGALDYAVTLLMDYGHRKIAFLSETLTMAKEEHFLSAATNRGCDDSIIVIRSRFRFEKAGEDGIRQLLERQPDTTAIICAYDRIAYGAIRQLEETGLRVPQDISIIGIDNISTSEYTKPTLTTIDTKPREVCQIAWELLQKKMQNSGYGVRQTIVIQTKLIPRDSVTQI